MRGDGENHHEKLGLKGTSCASQFTIPDTAGTSPNLACTTTDTRSSQPYQASRTPDFSYSFVSLTSFSSLSPISLFLVYNSTIITEYKVKSSLSISPCHDHELTPSTSIHRVQHIPSTAYTEYSIYRVQHIPSTAYTEYSIYRVQHIPSTACTQDCLSCLHSHDYELTPECSFSFQRASLHNRLPSASSP